MNRTSPSAAIVEIGGSWLPTLLEEAAQHGPHICLTSRGDVSTGRPDRPWTNRLTCDHLNGKCHICQLKLVKCILDLGFSTFMTHDQRVNVFINANRTKFLKYPEISMMLCVYHIQTVVAKLKIWEVASTWPSLFPSLIGHVCLV